MNIPGIKLEIKVKIDSLCVFIAIRDYGYSRIKIGLDPGSNYLMPMSDFWPENILEDPAREFMVYLYQGQNIYIKIDKGNFYATFDPPALPTERKWHFLMSGLKAKAFIKAADELDKLIAEAEQELYEGEHTNNEKNFRRIEPGQRL